MKNLNKKYLLIILITLSVIVLIGTSYGLLRSSQVGENSYVMNVGLLEVSFLDSETNALNISNMVPSTDEEGMSIDKELVFTVKNTGTIDAKYNVYIEETSTNPDFKTVIRYISNKNDSGYNSPKTLSENNFIDTLGELKVGESATYKVKVWLSEEADSTYMNQEFKARVVIEASQIEMLNNSLMNSIENSTCNPVVVEDGITYLSGDNNCINFNYVWYSGKQWRVTAIYPDGSMKLITEDLLTSISWGATPTVSSSNLTSAYGTSWLRQWLNQEFLPTLNNYKDIINESYEWNATTTTSPIEKPEETTLVVDPVGMLTAHEYYKSYQNATSDTGYLNIGYHWWLITPYNASLARAVYADGQLVGPDNNLGSSTGGVRASINFISNVKLAGGDGSSENPYVIKGDNLEIEEGTTNLNTRQSGEYVKIENDIDTERLFRIIGTEMVGDKLTTKLLLNVYVRLAEKPLSTSSIYGGGTSDTYWDYYLNNTYLETLNIDMLEKGKYYLGSNTGSTSYKATVCSEISNDVSVSQCIENNKIVSNTWTGYVGLPRVGEMFANQTKDYDYNNAYHFYLITPYGSSGNVGRKVQDNGILASAASATEPGAARPTIHLKDTIVIKSGSGTEYDPFIVGLPS